MRGGWSDVTVSRMPEPSRPTTNAAAPATTGPSPRIRSRSRAVALLAVLVLLGSLGSPPVIAGTGGHRDPRDTAGRLDIARIAHGHDGRRLVHRIRTHRGWGLSQLRGRNRLMLVAREDGDLGRLWVWRRNGTWWCKLSSPQRTGACSGMRGVSVAHPDRRTVVIKSRRPAHWEGGYRWRAGSRSGGHVDWAPRRGRWLRHPL